LIFIFLDEIEKKKSNTEGQLWESKSEMGITTIFENFPISTNCSIGHLFLLNNYRANFFFNTSISLNAVAFAQHSQARDHIALERLGDTTSKR
jgi:hypothetical protein